MTDKDPNAYAALILRVAMGIMFLLQGAVLKLMTFTAFPRCDVAPTRKVALSLLHDQDARLSSGWATSPRRLRSAGPASACPP